MATKTWIRSLLMAVIVGVADTAAVYLSSPPPVIEALLDNLNYMWPLLGYVAIRSFFLQLRKSPLPGENNSKNTIDNGQ